MQNERLAHAVASAGRPEPDAFAVMFPPDGGDTMSRRNNGDKREIADAPAEPANAASAKALAITCLHQLVTDGFAEWDRLDNGDIQLRLGTGETFLLAETAIIRLA